MCIRDSNNNSNNNQPAPANYTVTFVGADNAVLATQTVTSGAAAAKPADPVRKKYTFEGWYAGTTAYDFAAPVTADLTITAKWAKVSVSKEMCIRDRAYTPKEPYRQRLAGYRL